MTEFQTFKRKLAREISDEMPEDVTPELVLAVCEHRDVYKSSLDNRHLSKQNSSSPGLPEYTFVEIGKEIGISRARAQFVCERALKKLKRKGVLKDLFDALRASGASLRPVQATSGCKIVHSNWSERFEMENSDFVGL